MAGTILSIIVAIFFVLNALEVAWQPQYQSPIYVAASLLFLFIALIGRVMISKSVLRIQTKVMGAAQELYVKDRRLHLSLLYLFALCLFSIFITLTTLPSAFFYIWIIAFGVGFDILRFSLRRSYQYTSTSFLVTRLVADLEQAVKDKDEAKAFEWLDVVIDSAAKAVSKSNMHLAVSSIKAIQSLIETYVKELARTEMFQVSALEGLTFLDKVNTMCIFVAERLAWLFGMALKEGQQPVAESIVSEFGKMSVFFARHNVRVATIPISFLASVAQTAQSMAQEEVQTRIALTLSETTKQLLAYSKDRNESFKDLIMSTLLTLEQIVKSIFKQKRETNVLLLMQPFAEIAEFIGSSQMAQVPDRDNVLREIKRVLSEFQALQMVTMNLETMSPSIGEDTTSSYQQDLPYTK